jgi:hypothetical protein
MNLDVALEAQATTTEATRMLLTSGPLYPLRSKERTWFGYSKLHVFAAVICLLFAASCLNAQQVETGNGVGNANEMLQWRVLEHAEQEKGKPVQIVSGSGGNLVLSVDGRRGTAIRHLSPQNLPAVLSFDFESTYDSKASEIPTELFGTGDFRIFVGSRGDNAEELGAYEGLQLRIFPHLVNSPVRRVTGEESHTASSLWIRNIDQVKRINSDGDLHAGLMSDACQNRGRENGRHNCGWSRVSLIEGGFGLRNGEAVTISIAVDKESVEIRAGRWRHQYRFDSSQLRITNIDTLAIGHTNISRGYKTVKISNISVSSLLR